MRIAVFDIEGDGLDATKIYCLTFYSFVDNQLYTLTDYEEIKDFFLGDHFDLFVGHNIIRWDIPTLERILGVELYENLKWADTLAISYYLDPLRSKHNLDILGEEFFNRKKLHIPDWDNLPLEQYIERCEEDVRINTNLWVKFFKYLQTLYDGNEKLLMSLIDYLSFKMYMGHLKEKHKWECDIKHAEKWLFKLEEEFMDKVHRLSEVMPKVPVTRTRKPPKNMFKQNGELSSHGERWQKLLKDQGLPSDHNRPVEEVVSWDEPNPNSHTQIKDWLQSLGWKPITFKYVRDKTTGDTRMIPQVRKDGEICLSVQKLYDKEPNLELLEGMTVLSHRINILKGFLRDADDDGFLEANFMGFTNTLRLRHTTIVNLPGVRKPYGEQIRGSLIAGKGLKLCGSDMSALENQTRNHYIFPFDSEYVKTMLNPDYDSHLDICVVAELMSENEVELYKQYKKKDKEGTITEEEKRDYKRLDGIRYMGKQVNYSCLPVDNTQVLTKQGWRYRGDLSIGDTVLSYNRDTGLVEDDEILNIVDKEDDTIIMSNRHWEIESTSDHRWVGDRRVALKGKQRFYEPSETTTEKLNSEFRIINSAPYCNGSNRIIGSNEMLLLGFILSDGYVSGDGIKKASVSQSKKKYYKELKSAIDGSGLSYSEGLNNSGVNVFNFHLDKFRYYWGEILGLPMVGKHEINYTNFLMNLDLEDLHYFVEGFKLGDGHSTKYGVDVISQNKGSICEAIKLATTLLGYKFTVSVNGDLEVITISKRHYTTGQRIKKTEGRKTDVFCITTNNSTFICRQNNTVTITGNCVYGAGAKTLSRTLDISVKKAARLIEAYWDRNWSVREFASMCPIKKIGSQMWVRNPLSGYWHTLRYKKDVFSTVNQSTGVFCFDLWNKMTHKINQEKHNGEFKIIGDFHDEVIYRIPEGREDDCRDMLKEAIQKTNEILNLNVTLDVDVQFGDTYAEIH